MPDLLAVLSGHTKTQTMNLGEGPTASATLI
jgi:hypothetical protein